MLHLLLLPSFSLCSPSPCSSHSSEGYSCVPYYLCRDGAIVTDGKGLIDPRVAKERVVNRCQD